MDIQKFKRGDIVHIAADLGESMSHFESDKDVVILGSYADQFGGDNTKSYDVIFLDTGNECAWYYEHQLTLLRHGGEEIITKITKKVKAREAIETDMSWIIANWKDIRTAPPCATMTKLMALIGITEPWGLHGEGIDRCKHEIYTIKYLDAVLSTGDIKKVEEFIEDFPKVNEFVFSSDLYNGNNEFRRPAVIP